MFIDLFIDMFIDMFIDLCVCTPQKLECLGSGDKQIGFPERKIFMEYKLSPDFVWILIDVFEHQSEISLLSKVCTSSSFFVLL